MSLYMERTLAGGAARGWWLVEGSGTWTCPQPTVSIHVYHKPFPDLKVLAAGVAPFELIGCESLHSFLPCHLERPVWHSQHAQPQAGTTHWAAKVWAGRMKAKECSLWEDHNPIQPELFLLVLWLPQNGCWEVGFGKLLEMYLFFKRSSKGSWFWWFTLSVSINHCPKHVGH